MRSTQLNESFNANLKNNLKSDLNLVQFFTHFKRVEMENEIMSQKPIMSQDINCIG